jgi:hypothetical protein
MERGRRAEKPWLHPYTKTSTLINDVSNGFNRQIAWIDGAIWPSVGSVIELGTPNRDAVVLAVRLQLGPDDKAVILVDVEDAKAGDTIPRRPVDRLLGDR